MDTKFMMPCKFGNKCKRPDGTACRFFHPGEPEYDMFFDKLPDKVYDVDVYVTGIPKIMRKNDIELMAKPYGKIAAIMMPKLDASNTFYKSNRADGAYTCNIHFYRASAATSFIDFLNKECAINGIVAKLQSIDVFDTQKQREPLKHSYADKMRMPVVSPTPTRSSIPVLAPTPTRSPITVLAPTPARSPIHEEMRMLQESPTPKEAYTPTDTPRVEAPSADETLEVLPSANKDDWQTISRSRRGKAVVVKESNPPEDKELNPPKENKKGDKETPNVTKEKPRRLVTFADLRAMDEQGATPSKLDFASCSYASLFDKFKAKLEQVSMEVKAENEPLVKENDDAADVESAASECESVESYIGDDEDAFCRARGVYIHRSIGYYGPLLLAK